MRTPEELVAWYKSKEKVDMFGFMVQQVVPWLPYEHAKPFLKPEITAEDWSTLHHQPTREAVLAEMRDYMPFTAEKIRNERNLSVMRSAFKYSVWTWLLGDEVMSEKLLNEVTVNALLEMAKHYELPLEYPAELADGPPGTADVVVGLHNREQGGVELVQLKTREKNDG